jgi:hypothetical protein
MMPKLPLSLALSEPRSRARWDDVVVAWATRPLPLAVSGRLAVVLAVRQPGKAPVLVTVLGSLLARGYQGSVLTTLDAGGAGGSGSAAAFEQTLTALSIGPKGWLADWHLDPVPPQLAARLAWGLYLTSAALGTIDTAEIPGPGHGLVPVPAGTPAQWLQEFLGRFAQEQLDVIREISTLTRASRPGAGKYGSRPHELPIVVGLELKRAHSRALTLPLRAIMDRLPDFQPYRPPDEYMWLRSESDGTMTGPAIPRIAGILALNRPASWPESMIVHVSSASAAADLAARLEALLGELALQRCTWYPHEEREWPFRPHTGEPTRC